MGWRGSGMGKAWRRWRICCARRRSAPCGPWRLVMPGWIRILPPTGMASSARREDMERGLIFVGLVSIQDPLREDVREAVRQCRAGGIEVKMITGDNPDTARAIAAEIGLLDRPDARILTSQEFNALTDGEVRESLPRLRVLARARPLDKLRMVQLLQGEQEVVARDRRRHQ